MDLHIMRIPRKLELGVIPSFPLELFWTVHIIGNTDVQTNEAAVAGIPDLHSHLRATRIYLVAVTFTNRVQLHGG
jgi:hypothetical protein